MENDAQCIAHRYCALGLRILVMSVSVRRVHVVLSTAGFKGGGKPCRKTHETAALEGILAHLAGFYFS